MKVKGARALINVFDKGVGMDEETLESLVAPELVVSATGTRNEKGTGLGLTLCRDYLRKIRGELTARSTKGEGSTFTIEVPLRAE